MEEQIKDARMEVKTYDKRDTFKFEIIDYPDLSGNIPTKPAYGVFTSQVFRYARICSKKNDLLKRVKSLTKKTTTETLHHQWPQAIIEEMSEETSLDHDQTGPKTSPEPHRRITESNRRITINILGIFGTSWLLSDPGIPGVTLCFCTGSYAAAGAAAAAGRRFLSTR